MPVRVGINGFGSIGRHVVRLGIDDPDIEFVSVNDITDSKTLAHLFKYDSAHGIFKGTVEAGEEQLVIAGKRIGVTARWRF